MKFEGALTLTHNATSLILPGGANITTADGDVGWFISEGSGNWRCLHFMKAAVAPTGFSTGDVKLTLKTVADTGWVLMNDGTIGNASSGGTTRANADTESLFTLLWTNTADAQCAVSTGRGASAAADFAANKTIALPKALGRALAVYGAGSGLTSRALALATGTESETLTTSHLPASGLSIPSLSVSATGTGTATTYSTGGNSVATLPRQDTRNGATNQNVSDISVSVSGSTGTGTTGNMGTGGAHPNIQPTSFLNVMIKL